MSDGERKHGNTVSPAFKDSVRVVSVCLVIAKPLRKKEKAPHPELLTPRLKNNARRNGWMDSTHPTYVLLFLRIRTDCSTIHTTAIVDMFGAHCACNIIFTSCTDYESMPIHIILYRMNKCMGRCACNNNPHLSSIPGILTTDCCARGYRVYNPDFTTVRNGLDYTIHITQVFIEKLPLYVISLGDCQCQNILHGPVAFTST